MSANPKFLVLVRTLKLPLPFVRGLLDTLWDTCHAQADPVVGSPEEVEAAAQWPGKDGELFSALRDKGWIEPLRDTGKWRVHDYWDHCPYYVHERLKKRRQREDKKRSVPDSPLHVPGQSGDNLTLTSSLALASLKEQRLVPRKRVTMFIKPTLEEVTKYIHERGYLVDSEVFMAHYESNGWRVGKNPMKCWRSAVVTWGKSHGKDQRQDTKKAARAKEYEGMKTVRLPMEGESQ